MASERRTDIRRNRRAHASPKAMARNRRVVAGSWRSIHANVCTWRRTTRARTRMTNPKPWCGRGRTLGTYCTCRPTVHGSDSTAMLWLISVVRSRTASCSPQRKASARQRVPDSTATMGRPSECAPFLAYTPQGLQRYIVHRSSVRTKIPIASFVGTIRREPILLP